MKKILRLMALPFILILMFSCNKKEDTTSTDDRQVLKFAAFESGYGADMWRQIISEYEKINPNVKIELNISKDIESILPALIQAEDYPDVVMLSLGRADAIPEHFVKEKQLADLTSVLDMKVPGEDVIVKDKIIGGFIGNIITNPYEDQKVYMMPMFYSPTGLFYNKTLFEKNGWSLPETWDDMFKLFELAKQKGIYGLTYPTTGYLDSMIPPIIAGRKGLEFYNDVVNFKKSIWQSDEMDDVFGVLDVLAKNVHPTTVGNATDEGFKKNQQLLLDDKVLFMPNGSWIVEEMRATTPVNFKWGMMAYPLFEKGMDHYSFSFFEQIWVPKQAKNIDLAKDFIAFLYSDKASQIFAKSTAVQPIKSYPYDQLSENNQIFYKIYENGAKGIVGGFRPTEPVEGINFNKTLYESFNSVVNGTKTVDKWQNDVSKMMDTLSDHLVK